MNNEMDAEGGNSSNGEREESAPSDINPISPPSGASIKSPLPQEPITSDEDVSERPLSSPLNESRRSDSADLATPTNEPPVSNRNLSQSPVNLASPVPSQERDARSPLLTSNLPGYGTIAPLPPTILSNPPGFTPIILPEGLLENARPLNPDGSVSKGVLALAMAANGIAEFGAMSFVYGTVLPYVIDTMTQYDVGSSVNFGGLGGEIAQGLVQAGVAAGPLMVAETPSFGYGAEMVAAGMGGEVSRRDPYDVYPSFKIPSHPTTWKTTPTAQNTDPENNALPTQAEWLAGHEKHNAAIEYAQRHGFPDLIKFPDPDTDGYDANVEAYNASEQVKLRKKAYDKLKSQRPILTAHPGPLVVAGQLNPETQEVYTDQNVLLYQERLANHNAEVHYLNKCVLNHPYLLPPFGPGIIPPHPGFTDAAAVNAYNVHIRTINADGGFLSILENKRKELREGRFLPQQLSVEYANLDSLIIAAFFAVSEGAFKVINKIVNPENKRESGIFTKIGAGLGGLGFGATGAWARLKRQHNAPSETALLTEAHNRASAMKASRTLPVGTDPVPESNPQPISTPTHYVKNDWGLKAAIASGKHITHEIKELSTGGDEDAPYGWKEKIHDQARYIAAFGIGNFFGMMATNTIEAIMDHHFKSNSLMAVFTKEVVSTVFYVLSGDVDVLDDDYLENLYKPWNTRAFNGTRETWGRLINHVLFKEQEFPYITDVIYGDQATNPGAKMTAAIDYILSTRKNSIKLLQSALAEVPHSGWLGTKYVFKKVSSGVSYAGGWLPFTRGPGEYREINDSTPESLAEAQFNKAIQAARDKAEVAYIKSLCGEEYRENTDMQGTVEKIEQSEKAVREWAGKEFAESLDLLKNTTKPDEEKIKKCREALQHIKNSQRKQRAEEEKYKVFIHELVKENTQHFVQCLANNLMSADDVAASLGQLLEDKKFNISHQQFAGILQNAIDKVSQGQEDLRAQLMQQKPMLIDKANQAINKRIVRNVLEGIPPTLSRNTARISDVDPESVALKISNMFELVQQYGMPEEALLKVVKTVLAPQKVKDKKVQKALTGIEDAITKKVQALWSREYHPFGESVEEEDLNVVLQKEIKQRLAKDSPEKITEDLAKKLVDPTLHETSRGKRHLLIAEKSVAQLICYVVRQQQLGRTIREKPKSREVKINEARKEIKQMLIKLISHGDSIDMCKKILEQHIHEKPQGTTRIAMQEYLPVAIEVATKAKTMVDEIINTAIREGKSLKDCKSAVQTQITKNKKTSLGSSSGSVMQAYLPQAMQLAKYAISHKFMFGYQHVDLPLDKTVKGEGLNTTQIAVATGGGQNHARIYTLKLHENVGGLTPEKGKPIEGKLTGPARDDKSNTQGTELNKKPVQQAEKKSRRK